MERNVVQLLDGMVRTTRDPGVRALLERHRAETEEHASRLAHRLSAHGASPSLLKEGAGLLALLATRPLELMGPESPLRTARDGYALEHFQIAAYELLERLAVRAGDAETPAVARLNRADEEAFSWRIASHWDLFVDLTVEEAQTSVSGP